jgi:cystathionine beta-lyase
MEKPQATFLAWLDCTALGLADPHEHFLRKARVGLSAGADFGAAYGQFVRLNFGCPRPLLVEAIERMAASL